MSDGTFWGLFLISSITITATLLLVHEAGKHAGFERGYVHARRRVRERRMYEARDTLATTGSLNNNYEWRNK